MLTNLRRSLRFAVFSCHCVLFLFVAAFTPVATVAKGDTLYGGVPINWDPNSLYPGSSYIPGLYYWNNDSGDGGQANIGWCLIGGGQCNMQNPPGRIPFYTAAGPSAPASLYFSSTGQGLRLTLDAVVTNQKNGGSGEDFFGYYSTDVSGNHVGSPVILFNSNQPLGSTMFLSTFSAGQNYAFFLENIQGYGTGAQQTTYSFYMNSAANSSTGSMPADNMQHFAAFQNGSTFYLGAVDGDACAGTFTVNNSPCIPASAFDYNDMVVQISPDPDPEPEPATAALFALGAICAGIYCGAAFRGPAIKRLLERASAFFRFTNT